MNFCEGLNFLSVRWVQPSQQHGRRIPSLSSETTLPTCSFLFSGLLTEIAQQIHSFRASGVISSHFVFATGEEIRAFFRSAGSLWGTAEEVFIGAFFFLNINLQFAFLIKPDWDNGWNAQHNNTHAYPYEPNHIVILRKKGNSLPE